MAKRKSDDASEPGLKRWDRKKTPKFPVEFASEAQRIAEDYLRQTIAMGAGFTPPTRAQFFRECVSQFALEFEGTAKKSLNDASASLHHAAFEACFRRWIAGETKFETGHSFTLPKVAAGDVPKLTALFARTSIQHYEWNHRTEERYGHEIRGRCDFTIGKWKASATWGNETSDSRGDDESELHLTDYGGGSDFSVIEKRVKSELPPHLLGAFLYLVAFDLLNIDYHGRPKAKDFPLLPSEDE